ncbi:hypothetical protein LXA43DRAFT_1010761, partial [Ganoderma leucocontextum]
ILMLSKNSPSPILSHRSADLVPRDNAQAWLRYLRHSTPTLPFKSASSHQRTNLSSSTGPALLRLLKAYKPTAQSIAVGIVGYPNVGKSSLINSLKRSKVCALERGLRIIDSPGVVFDVDDFDDGKAASSSARKSNILLRNVVKVEDVPDPVELVEEILARTDCTTVKKLYNVEDFASPLEFLTMLALLTGRLLKGGTPDVLAAARHVLMDWNHQKIPYFSVPPSVHPSLVPSTVPGTGGAQVAPGAENVGQAQILTELSAPPTPGAFGGGGDGADAVMEDDADAFVPDEAESMDEDEKQMESDDLAAHIPRKRSRSPSGSVLSAPASTSTTRVSVTAVNENARQPAPKRLRRSHEVPAYDAPIAEHARQRMAGANPLSRKVLKKEAKKARRAANRAVQSERMREGMEVDEDATVALGTTFLGSGSP